MDDFYLYSINARKDIRIIDLAVERLEDILKSGYILTREELGMSGHGFNGLHYISLSDYSKRNNSIVDGYNSYNLYSTKSLSIMIDKNKVKAIEPILIKPIESAKIAYLKFVLASWGILEGMYSDLPDEVQVSERIKCDTFTGITIPTLEIARKFDIDKVKEIYKRIKILLAKYQQQMSIYDISSLEEVKDNNIEDIIKRSF